jgi:hypothetical protein
MVNRLNGLTCLKADPIPDNPPLTGPEDETEVSMSISSMSMASKLLLEGLSSGCFIRF